VIITIEHVRGTKGFNTRGRLCVIGTRAWFKTHNLDFADFLDNGIDEEILLATGDAFAIAVVEQAHGEE
jgi:hypothetical protein